MIQFQSGQPDHFASDKACCMVQPPDSLVPSSESPLLWVYCSLALIPIERIVSETNRNLVGENKFLEDPEALGCIVQVAAR